MYLPIAHAAIRRRLLLLAWLIVIVLGSHVPPPVTGGIVGLILVLPFLTPRDIPPGRFCRRCGHDLKTLLCERCPECGVILGEGGVVSEGSQPRWSLPQIVILLTAVCSGAIVVNSMAQ